MIGTCTVSLLPRFVWLSGEFLLSMHIIIYVAASMRDGDEKVAKLDQAMVFEFCFQCSTAPSSNQSYCTDPRPVRAMCFVPRYQFMPSAVQFTYSILRCFLEIQNNPRPIRNRGFCTPTVLILILDHPTVFSTTVHRRFDILESLTNPLPHNPIWLAVLVGV